MDIKKLKSAVMYLALAGAAFSLVNCQSWGLLERMNEPDGAPANVKLMVGNGNISISWDRLDSATAYNVYSSMTPGVTTDPANLIASKLTDPFYNYVASKHGITFYFIVTALNGASEGPPSWEVSTVNTHYCILDISTIDGGCALQ